VTNRRTRIARRTALQARTPLQARTGLERKNAAMRRAPLRPVSDKRRAAGQVKSAAKKKGPTPEVRALVLARDGYACACCGVSVIGRRYSLGHRLRASQGGKPVPSNLLTFLGLGGEACHGRIDQRRRPADEDRGLTVRSYMDPALVPVTLFDGRRVWLDDAGRYLDCEPEGLAA
jgi:hypothetical protein